MKKEYDGKIQTEDGKKNIVKWVNTNKLLDKQGYCGVKTGVTSSAGPCLSTNYRYEFYNFIIIVLNSRTMEERWSDTMEIVKFGISKVMEL